MLPIPPRSFDFLSKLKGSEISVTGAVTATIGRMHVCSGTSADYTVTLPAVSGNAGKSIGFRMSGALTKMVTLDGNSAEEIDGEIIRIMWANESAILFCDGTAWTKIGGKSIPMMVSAYSAADQTGLTSSVFTKAILGTEVRDTGNVFASSTITVKRPAEWNIAVSTAIQAETTNILRSLTAIYHNSTAVERVFDVTIAGHTSIMSSFGALDLDLAITDTIELYGFGTTSSGLWKMHGTTPTSKHRTGITAHEVLEW